MRLMLCGGGTAGHVNPAIAIAEELKNRDEKSVILFVGRKNGKENEAIKKAGFLLKNIEIYGLKRSISTENIKRVICAFQARKAAKKIIKDFKPDVILGTGGYVCWPIISAGKAMGIPVAIHESNISPGLTTKVLSKKCDVVFLNREETKNSLNKNVNTKVVGNPIKRDFAKITKAEARSSLGISQDEILVVSFGGSIGAEKINEAVLKMIEDFSSKDENIKHIHATGQRYFSDIKPVDYEKKGCNILPFIDNMPTVLKAADIAICRSGAMTVSELSTAGVASILIPSPNVSGNHQFHNAKYLSDRGAAVLIEEKNLTADALINAVKTLKNDKNGRKTRAKNIKTLCTPNSAKTIVDELFLLKNSSKKADY